MLLHMIMHRILALFDNVAFGANKVAVLVLGILQCHGFTFFLDRPVFNFYSVFGFHALYINQVVCI